MYHGRVFVNQVEHCTELMLLTLENQAEKYCQTAECDRINAEFTDSTRELKLDNPRIQQGRHRKARSQVVPYFMPWLSGQPHQSTEQVLQHLVPGSKLQ